MGYGANVAEGLAQGIAGSMGLVEDAMGGLSAVVGQDMRMGSVYGPAAASQSGAAGAASAFGGVAVYVTVEAREGEDGWELGRRVGNAAAYELRLQGYES